MVMTTVSCDVIAADNECSSACDGHGSTGLGMPKHPCCCMHVVNLHLSWQLRGAVHFKIASD